METIKRVFIDALLATYSTDTRSKSGDAVTDLLYTDNEDSHKITNHPVHIFDKTKKDLSPSSFIPFCDFGGKAVGVKIDQFHTPVCNSFKARVLNDQLCYEFDPNSYDYAGRESFSKGLTLFIDNNVERMYPKTDSG